MGSFLQPFVSLLSRNNLRSERLDKRNIASRLPAEVLLIILEDGYYNQDTMEPDTQLLSSCSLVCRAWSTPSQLLLFRQVLLRTARSFRAFMTSVSGDTERSCALANAVVSIKAVVDYKNADQLTPRALALAVNSSPCLYEIDITFYGCDVPEQSPNLDGSPRIFRAAPSFDDGILSMLRSGPQIRSLKLANWSDNGEISFQLLSDVWPTLEYVALRGKAPCLPLLDDHLVVPFTCTLRSLRLGLTSSANTDLLKWLMASSRSTLRFLELESVPASDTLTSVLQQCGRHLESVSLASCSTRDQANALRPCQSLKEFIVESSAASPLLHALDRLPTTVEHVAFTLGCDTPVYLIIKFVKARRNLKAVTVYVWRGADSHKELPALRLACAWRGVKLSVCDDTRLGGFRESVRGDPIPTNATSFPRGKSSLNLTKMLVVTQRRRGSLVKDYFSALERREEVDRALAQSCDDCFVSSPTISSDERKS